MRFTLGAAMVAVLSASPAWAESALERGFAGALRGCEEWVLNPESWTTGLAPFVSAVGLGEAMALVKEVDEAALPPEAMRSGAHYWRINSARGAGFILVVSDRLPICHITGGGDVDLQPAVSSALGAPGFTGRWEQMAEEPRGEVLTTVFRNRAEPAFSIVVSRAKDPGQRLDRTQVLATAVYQIKN